MSQISVNNLTFAYDGSYDNVFEDVSLCLDTDWRLGFVGRNGKGKTTFLNLLMEKYEYKGTITANVDFIYFPFEIADRSEYPLDIASRICPGSAQWELEREIGLLELDPGVLFRPYETLSLGEQTKLMLAMLFLKDNGFLLIDEPTNHLDSHARTVVSKYLNSKKGFILVSHDRIFLDNCTDHILSINRADITVTQGNFTVWYENKMLQDAYETAENERLHKEIKRLGKAARRAAEWSDKAERSKIGFDPRVKEKSIGARAYEGEKSRKLMQQSKNYVRRKQDAIESKSSLLRNVERKDELKIRQMDHHARRLVYLDDVSIFYGETEACRGVGFSIERGDRVALKGRNGSGKTSIIRLICDKAPDHTGTVEIANGLVVSYVSQDTGFLVGNLSEHARVSGIDETLLKAILNKLDFNAVQFDKDMADLSEGQKKKVLIARSLCEKAHLHVWDEPLNFIDVISRMQIEELIQKYKPTMLFVEHDDFFCSKIATKEVLL